jgi:hypothetical protein
MLRRSPEGMAEVLGQLRSLGGPQGPLDGGARGGQAVHERHRKVSARRTPPDDRRAEHSGRERPLPERRVGPGLSVRREAKPREPTPRAHRLGFNDVRTSVTSSS